METSGVTQTQMLIEAAVAPAVTRQAIGVEVLDQALEAATANNAALLAAMPPLAPGVGRHLNMLV
jgi:hypothetical protein